MTSTISAEAISPLRRRMIEDMSVRKFAEQTQHDISATSKPLPSFSGALRIRQQVRTCAAIRFIKPRPAFSRRP